MNNDRRKQLAALLEDLQQTGLRDAMDNLSTIRDQLENIKGEEEEARDNLPESVQNGERGEKMQEAIAKMEEACDTLTDLIDGFDFDRLDEAFSAIDEARA